MMAAAASGAAEEIPMERNPWDLSSEATGQWLLASQRGKKRLEDDPPN